MKTRDEVLSCFGGLFDGEGCFTIAKNKVSKKYSSRPFRFQAYARLNIKDKVLVDLLQKWFGGSTRLQKRTNPNHAAIWTWQINGKNLDKFLVLIREKLIIKQHRCDIMTEFQKVKAKVGNRPISDHMYKKSEEYYKIMRSLNYRGAE